MQEWTFRSPELIIFGEGKAGHVGELVKGRTSGKILLLTGPVLLRTGVVEPVLYSLRKAGVPLTVYAERSGEPTSRDVEKVLELFHTEGCTAIIACGGGGPIDLAKATSLLSANDSSLADLARDASRVQAGPPVFALPTTAGSGSEVSGHTVIIDARSQEKLLISSPTLIPTAAVLDPQLCMSMPPALTATTGMDAMTHAIESRVSRKASAMTIPLSLRAVSRLARFLPQAYTCPEDKEARSQCMLAALEAGLAFSNASVALVHGMARPLGAKFGIAHGLGNAMLLDTVTTFSLEGDVQGYAQLAEVMGADIAELAPLEAAQLLPGLLRDLRSRLDIPRLREHVSKEALASQISTMAREALESGSPANNPRSATADDIVQLYEAAW